MSRTAWRVIGVFAAVVLVGAVGIAVWLIVAEKQSQIGAVDAGSSPAAAPTAIAVPVTASADDRMNDFLDQHGNPADQHERMRDTAREACRLLGTTGSYNDQLTMLESQANMSEAAAKVFLNGAIGIYCPVYQELVPTH